MMRKTGISSLGFSFIGLVILNSLSQAATVKELATCSAKTDNVERLNCFDDLAKAENADQPEKTTISNGDWDVTSETSKINDKTNVYLHIQSKDTVSQRFGGEQNAELWITCREEQTSFYLTFGNLFLADNGSYGDVTLRIDKQKARVISMTESTNNQALGLWRGSAGKLIKSMFGAKSLFVQVTPF